MKKNIIFITGPTAVGKTETAFIVAKKINAEIISCDSMQVYRGMDIITSKDPISARKKVPHHLVDVISPENEYNVSRYRKEALTKIKQIIKKGKIPLFVGGTGLYMTILIDGIFEARAQSKAVRERLYGEAEEFGRGYVYNRLKKVDPQAAAKIHPNDTKRIVRALEVYEITGRQISQLQAERKGLCGEYNVMIFCLNMERDKLYKKIDKRVDRMFADGLANEVNKLLRLKLSKTASCAIGIKELKGYLDGLYDLEEAKRMVKRNTRLYAKRQLTWFRKDRRIHWIAIGENEKPKEIAGKIWNELS